jgi:Kef-type K+ transport system membrane component KefB
MTTNREPSTAFIAAASAVQAVVICLIAFAVLHVVDSSQVTASALIGLGLGAAAGMLTFGALLAEQVTRRHARTATGSTTAPIAGRTQRPLRPLISSHC